MELQAGTFNPDDFNWRGLIMTPAAAAHIRELVSKQPPMQGLRLGVKTSGCAGFAYVMELIAEPAKDDLLFEFEGAKLWAPLQAMPFIDGTELDYVREGLNEIFKFHNPKAQHECGCGESFGVQAE
ncbi:MULTISPECIES: Fe-S cluster assembly scaffold SufA [Raoultella]|jgi:Fe-S cluster assembly protein SufA|uniref:Fe-S cluster assembly scaffold SufA n=1 Tax=Raoultella terrigena TaxID=577 RepID=A0A485BTC0_RAOTE|nr:Fe-S cluster assembly scaffold SufA [Raoultella terrigena]AJF73695.1 iron-sulfur cluster assembly scaffold protein [Raoultella ornithinolytica]QPF10750.1 Fe-S cluster assembly scaffold SufA [Raoultella terrigena]WJV41008.1 Fe-S cluster assembly scaffold SufA [Raoultella terrigena]VFS74928.1 iron-sulfur cluster assembly scaffold protein [Raoultella terrigena]GEC69692.1 Fe-S cluster assembly scaffold SufA [Raoultella terrigena]